MTRAAFYDAIRPMFGGAMKQSQVDGTEALLAATAGMQITHRAYVLATAMHETAYTMQPIREYGKGKGKAYGKIDQTGKAPYGRGYVQLTWRDNYLRADDELDLQDALAKDYDLALQPTIAAKIIVRGMSEGWFTGKKLSDYLPGDYVNARRIVNGIDKAKKIAAEAVTFERALRLLGDEPSKPLTRPVEHVKETPKSEHVKPKPVPVGGIAGAIAALVGLLAVWWGW